MNRRTFLTRAAVSAAILGSEVAILKSCSEPTYQPIGSFAVGSPGWQTAQVFLDGRKVDHVFELNDVEGWLRRYTDAKIGADRPPIERLTGAVEVRWPS